MARRWHVTAEPLSGIGLRTVKRPTATFFIEQGWEGDLRIIVPASKALREELAGGRANTIIRLDFEDVRHLVLEYLRERHAAHTEDTLNDSDDEFEDFLLSEGN